MLEVNSKQLSSSSRTQNSVDVILAYRGISITVACNTVLRRRLRNSTHVTPLSFEVGEFRFQLRRLMQSRAKLLTSRRHPLQAISSHCLYTDKFDELAPFCGRP